VITEVISMLNQHKMVRLGFAAVIAVWALAQLLFSACGKGTGAVTPTPTRTPRLEATASLAATQPPTRVAPTGTAQASATPTADTSIVTDFPPNVNPLTGLRVSDPSVLDRRPLAIKISNAPAVVRPQAGLSFADLVFEHYAEGGVTRFTAVFLSQDAPKVGSVRSGRLIDLEIPAFTRAMFAYSGSSGGVRQEIVDSDFFQEGRVISPDFGVGEPVFVRVPEPGKAFEHTLFTRTDALWALTTERGLNTRQDLHGLAFRETSPKDGQPARYVEIAYLPGNASAEWSFDPDLGLYRRSILGEPHTDALTGQQLTAANVIIVYANHVETDILEDLVGGGHYSIEIQIWGEGSVQIVRDGQAISGRWVRRAREDMLSFFDETGDPLPLKPGNSWFQVVPLDFPVVIQP
jgi:hypothetical protein